MSQDILSRGDAHRGASQLAKIASGTTTGVKEDDALAALRELAPDVCLEFVPEDALSPVHLSWTGEAYRIHDWPVPDDWDAEALSFTEAAALLDGGIGIKPVETEVALDAQ